MGGLWCKLAAQLECWALPNMYNRASKNDLFKGRHFEQEIIILCVRWYLRYKLS